MKVDVSSTYEGQTLVFYMNLAPADWTNKNVYVVIQSTDYHVYQGQLACKKMESGKAYRYSPTMVDVSMYSQIVIPSYGPTTTIDPTQTTEQDEN